MNLQSPNKNEEVKTAGKRFSTHRILSGMRIRKKLIVLHTAFSLGLGIILLIAVKPAMSKVIFNAEVEQSERILQVLLGSSDWESAVSGLGESSVIVVGDEAALDLPPVVFNRSRQQADESIEVAADRFAAGVVRWLPDNRGYVLVRARSQRARDAIQLVYLLLIITLIVGYGLVAAALELFVLPQHVYRPISAMLFADNAVSDGDRLNELIPESEIPADELGSIMSSRNEAILALRNNEEELAIALDRLEHTAADLHKKNHLLETARKNLEGADRLASLGMMSAGIAHELNTPLAVVKGLVEKLNRERALSDTEIALLTRVVRRLETLSDGLLDFARVRPPMNKLAELSSLILEACTLVSLDRKDLIQRHNVVISNATQGHVELCCDPDRLVQVFVNLIRNAVDAVCESGTQEPRIEITMEIETREGSPWVAVRILDNGPGIDSELIDRLFEPFVSTRLDSQGTGLGLAVANGIVREHNGLLTATNRKSTDRVSGAVFEVMLPLNNLNRGNVKSS